MDMETTLLGRTGRDPLGMGCRVVAREMFSGLQVYTDRGRPYVAKDIMDVEKTLILFGS
jgi:hypothetical protein